MNDALNIIALDALGETTGFNVTHDRIKGLTEAKSDDGDDSDVARAKDSG